MPLFFFVFICIIFVNVSCQSRKSEPLIVAGRLLQDDTSLSSKNELLGDQSTWSQGERIYFLSSQEMSFLLNVAYDVAAQSVAKKKISFELKGPLPARLTQISLPVFVCYYWDNQETSCLSSKGSNLYNNTLQAAIRAANDTHYGQPLVSADKSRLRILISIELAQAQLNFPKVKKHQVFDPEIWEAFFSQQMGEHLEYGLRLQFGPVKSYALNSTIQAFNLQGLALAEFMCKRADLPADCFKNPQIHWEIVRYFQFINEPSNMTHAQVLRSLSVDYRPSKPTRQSIIQQLFQATQFLGRMFEESKKESILLAEPLSNTVVLNQDIEYLAMQWATLMGMQNRLKTLLLESQKKYEGWFKKAQNPESESHLIEKRKRQQILLQKALEDTNEALLSLEDESVKNRFTSLQELYVKKLAQVPQDAVTMTWSWLLQTFFLPPDQFLIHPDVWKARWQSSLASVSRANLVFLSFHTYEVQKMVGKFVLPNLLDTTNDLIVLTIKNLPPELMVLNSLENPEKKISLVEALLAELDKRLQKTFGPLSEALLKDFNNNLHPEFWEQFGQGFHTSLGNNFFENMAWGLALIKVRPYILKYSTLQPYLARVDFALDLIAQQLLRHQFNSKNDNMFWLGDANFWQGSFRADSNVQTVELMNQIYAVWFLNGLLIN